MRACDSRRLLFVHVEKTGGSTIDAMLDSEIPDSRSMENLARHAPLGRILRSDPQLAAYWTFGFVRNPWERMVSWWAMVCDVLSRADAGDPECLQRLEDTPKFWGPVSRYDDFEEFLRRGTQEVVRLRRPQVDYLHAPKWQRRADFIGRMETFAADVALVRARLGLSPLDELPTDNTSPHGEFRDYYTPSTRAFVGRVFAKDIEEFGYTFQPRALRSRGRGVLRKVRTELTQVFVGDRLRHGTRRVRKL